MRINYLIMLLKSEIEKIFFSQQGKFAEKHNHISRTKAKNIQTNNNFVQVISGIRRSGKSTLLKLLAQNYSNCAYLNFEDPRLVNFQVEDFSKLYEITREQNLEVFFFDEIQNVNQWELFIRQLHDDQYKVYITGSNASLLSKDLGTRLTGRYLNVELFPFSYNEFLEHQNTKSSQEKIKEYIKSGGFPEYFTSQNPEILQNLFKDILLRDIAVRYGIRNINVLMDIALFLLSNISKETTYNSIKNNFGVGSTNTVLDYLSWMEDAYLLFFLKKFSYSTKKMLVNPRKVYAIDNGLVSCNSISFSEDYGRKLENAVFIHLRNLNKKMFYFKQKNECDFLVFNQERCVNAIQVCYELNSSNKNREINGLIEALHFFDLSDGQIITFDQKDTLIIDQKTINIIPAIEFFATEF